MESIVEFFQQNNDFVRQWGYLVLLGAAWAEGLHSMILGGFVASLGQLNIHWVLVVMTAGHVLAGMCWYAVGYFGGAKPLFRWGRRIKLDEKKLGAIQKYFERYGGRAILVTKFTVGFTIATLIAAGVLKMHFRKFLWYNFVGSAGWTALTVLFGYSFGLSYRLLLHYMAGFTKAFAFFLAFLGGAIVLYHLLRLIFRTKIFRAIGNGFVGVLANGGGQRGQMTGQDGGSP